MTGTRLGIDRVGTLAGSSLRSARFGLVTNDVALTSTLRPGRDEVLRSGLALTRLFSPEHGLSAQGRDGSFQADSYDALTGLPVTSLYGERLAPDPESLAGLDAVIVDLPDVGCRFYTYLWTMSLVMESCSSAGIPVVVLDRPNPLGGAPGVVEGPLLDEEHCASFIGRWSMPVRHSLTMGELARLWTHESAVDVEVVVVGLEGWDRDRQALDDTRPWIPPSPGMPTAHTAALYPGLGLLEGVNVSDGRGTALPFRAVGAPWIDPLALWREFEALELPGVAATPYSFTPTAEKYRGETCFGLLLTVTDTASLRPVAVGVELIRVLGALWPEHLAEHRYVTRANPSGTRHLDLLLGVPDAARGIAEGSIDLSVATTDWWDRVQPALLY
ncbi:DUF1343 domain-containing protein [Leifsonia sp. H3M29-4]|uniref:exo-beta-N-acetylmuramidase NamZ family protein n=1 Tax=Salinibacterium metalliresistens TaxID=3031321 RepID=UPI0023DB7736|nr:DUF1343 domain-containing protein [Salinibacterium metalliresistens]MDF1478285.1 DUF1343 domain-containing protein [Salinibacterium metalliresistens]